MSGKPSPPRLRVLHVIKGLGRGGAETLLPTNLAYRDRERFEFVCAYFVSWKRALVGELEQLGVPTHDLSLERRAGIVFWGPLRLLRLIRRERPHLVHAHLPLAGFAARLACRWAGVPLVYTEHNLQESYHPLTRLLQHFTWKWQRAVVAVSEQVARSISRRLGRAVPVKVIHNGVPVEAWQFTPELREQGRKAAGLDGSAPVVGTVAVFRRAKRLDRWLEVAAGVRRELPQVRFLLVGDGPLRAEVKAAVRERQLEEATVLPGLVADPRAWIAAMDLFLLTSDFEGLPVAVLEAMALERPVVATAVGGVPEVVVPGITGFLHSPEDAAGLTTSVLRLLADSQLRRTFGVHARERVERYFSAAGVQRQLEALYRKVAGWENDGENS